jgi:activating signal cointegrator complex subunit 3
LTELDKLRKAPFCPIPIQENKSVASGGDHYPHDGASTTRKATYATTSDIRSSSTTSSSDKANILLQFYISNHSKHKLSSFTLISDTNYVAQNGSRVARALFDICLKKNWPIAAALALNLAKAIDMRMWWHQSPLRRFTNVLPFDAILKVEEWCRLHGDSTDDRVTRGDFETLAAMQAEDMAKIVGNARVAATVLKHVRYLPFLDVAIQVQPLTEGLCRMNIRLTCNFQWHDGFHGNVESWWIWVEDSTAEYAQYNSIYHAEHVLIHKEQYYESRRTKTDHRGENDDDDHNDSSSLSVIFHLPIFEASTHYMLRILSDRWVGVDSYHDVAVPNAAVVANNHKNGNYYYTPLLKLHPLPISALQSPTRFEPLYHSIRYFNPIQTQVFHALYHGESNILLGAPTGSGKTIVAELAMLKVWRDDPERKANRESIMNNDGNNADAISPRHYRHDHHFHHAIIVYVAPLKALARERVVDWTKKFAPLGKRVVELTGDTTVAAQVLREASIIITTPEKWDVVTRSAMGHLMRHHRRCDPHSNEHPGRGRAAYRLSLQHSFVSRVRLVVLDEIHLLGEERGPVIEAIVARMRMMNHYMMDEHHLDTNVPENQRRHHHQHGRIRLVGLSTALANAVEVGKWMGISAPQYHDTIEHAEKSTAKTMGHLCHRGRLYPNIFNFSASVRPIPMEVHVQGFPGRHYLPRMTAMNKPTYQAIQMYSREKPVLVFVSSRSQTRRTAMALIAMATLAGSPKQFLHVDEEVMEAIQSQVRDQALKDALVFGIGLHHAGMCMDHLCISHIQTHVIARYTNDSRIDRWTVSNSHDVGLGMHSFFILILIGQNDISQKRLI